MSKKLTMLNLNGYYNYIAIPESVSAQGVLDLIQATVYKKDSQTPWKLEEGVRVEVLFIDSNELPAPSTPEVLEIGEILAENNRLTRENEMLKEKLERQEKIKRDSEASKKFFEMTEVSEKRSPMRAGLD